MTAHWSCKATTGDAEGCWWQTYLSAWIAGVTGAATYHFLQQRQIGGQDKPTDNSLMGRDVIEKANKPVFGRPVTSNALLRITVMCFDATKQIVSKIPDWAWISAPAYVALLTHSKAKSWLFLGTSLFCCSTL